LNSTFSQKIAKFWGWKWEKIKSTKLILILINIDYSILIIIPFLIRNAANIIR
jgi:hypothetical protein